MQAQVHLWFWGSAILLFIISGFLLFDKWKMAIRNYRKQYVDVPIVLHFGGITTLTALFLMLGIAMYAGSGPVADSKPVQLNAPAEAKPEFLEAESRNSKDLKAHTRSELEEMRTQARTKETKQLEQKQQQKEERGADDMNGFRQKIMNRRQ